MKPIFNKIYILESLENETLTGKSLAEDMQTWRYLYANKTGINLEVEYIQALTEPEFIQALNKIKSEAAAGVIPVVHLEMHGVEKPNLPVSCEKYTGIQTAGDLHTISWERLASLLRDINIACHNNLLLTMAVCFGAWLQQRSMLDKEAMVWCTVGSFHKLFNTTILLKYGGFYEKLLCEADFDLAFSEIKKDNPNAPDSLALIDSYMMFRQVYANYIAKNVEDPAGVSLRIRQMMWQNPWLHWMFGNNAPLYIWRMLEHTKQEYYREHARKFLMIDRYAENAQRFPLPPTTNELLTQQRNKNN